MDKFIRVVILALVIQLAILSGIVAHLSYKLGYEKGRSEVYNNLADDGMNVGTCYVKGGCK